MGTQPENPTYDPTVYQWEITDPVQGGINGVANSPLLSLSNRTAYLKQRLDSLINGTLIPPTVAPLNGPAFTGSPTAPNVADGDDSQLIANTHFVQRRDHGVAYVTVTGGTVVLTQPQWGVGIIILTGALTSNATIIFPTNIAGRWVFGNFTTGGFSVTARTLNQTAGAPPPVPPQGYFLHLMSDGTNVWRANNQLTKSGEVASADLAPTGVTPASYNKATIAIGADGRITQAANGTLTLAEILGALGFTPVQQGGGAGQGNNKVFFGWDGARMKVQVDSTDMGEVPFISDFRFTSPLSTFQSAMMQWPCLGSPSGKMYLQVGIVAAVHSGSGSPETTVCAFNQAFPYQCYGVTGSYLGATPPPGNVGGLAFQPISPTQFYVTVNSTAPESGLGCVYFAVGL